MAPPGPAGRAARASGSYGRGVATLGLSPPASRLVASVERGSAALELLDRRWDDLVARQTLPNPTLSAAWLRELARWRTGAPLVAVVEEGGALLAGAALEARHGGRLAPAVATWFGPVQQLFSPDLLGVPGRPDAVAALLDALFAEVDVLSVQAPLAGVAATALAANAPWRRVAPLEDRWLLPWPAPRLDYARSRAGYEVRRGARRGVDVQVRVAAAPDEVAAALVRLFRVHRDRWRDRPEETARFATTAMHRAWNRRTVGLLAAAGRVRIAEVLEDGRPVAGCLGFVHGRGGLGHTWAVRPGGAVRQPGHVAVLACVEALAAAGAETIDLGITSGDANSPKARLGSTPDPVGAIFAAGDGRRQHRYEAMLGAVRVARRIRAR